MSSTFGTLNAASSGLNAAQLGMSITTQNISNADTPGYTRQALDVSGRSPDTGAYRFGNGSNKVGQGVDVNSVYQIRNTFLDVRYRYQNSDYNLHNSMNTLLSPIESQFKTIASSTATTNKLTGLSGALDGLVTDLGKFQNASTDSSIGSTIRSDCDYITSTIRNDANYLNNALSSANKELQIYVIGGSGDTSNGNISGGINGIVDEIQQLNSQIMSYEITGNRANDLRDQRNTLLDDLSRYVDIDTTESQDGSVSIKLCNDSKSIIDSKNNATHFDLAFKNGTFAYQDGGGTAQYQSVRWGDTYDANGAKISSGSGDIANIQGGIVKAYLNVINGDGSGTEDAATGQYGGVGIKAMMTKLNKFAKTFADLVNNTGSGKISGIDHTTELISNRDDPTKIGISSAWSTNPDAFITKCAASVDKATAFKSYVSALKDKGNATVTEDIGNSYSGSLMDYADSVAMDLATQISVVKQKSDASKISTKNLDTQRKSISSVSTNDEGINIIKYQQAYNANSRIISAIDQMLDRLINSTGKVGL